MEYAWPGNIRELENAIEHAFVICDSNQIDLKDLPVEIRNDQGYLENISYSTNKVAKLTKPDLLKLLDECNWNKAEVGRRIQKSRTSVWKYMKKWDVPLQKY